MLIRSLPQALVSLVLLATSVAAVPHDAHHVKRIIINGPADTFRSAINPARLPYDIGGVVGGYVLAVLVWAVLILTVGRSMRRKALEPPTELELKRKPMLAIRTAGAPSPPLSSRSWLRKFKKNDSTMSSPTMQSPTSFDQRVLDAHRSQNQADMERLYAAVMDHDAKKNLSRVSVQETEDNVSNYRRPSQANLDDSPTSPISPVRAIFPPSYGLPASPRSSRVGPPASPRSVVSKCSQTSVTSAVSKSARFNLKNLRITGPANKYPGASSDDEARTPLSPRFGPVVPSPPADQASPTTPYDPATGEELDQIQPLPRPTPHRHPSMSSTPNQSTSTLPLRSFAEPLNSPHIQTTVLDRRFDKLQVGTPKTGVPFTPYSPYMPFTPITPVTPRLVSRQERKKVAKIESRRAKAVHGLEEMVQSPKEIFGDAY